MTITPKKRIIPCSIRERIGQEDTAISHKLLLAALLMSAVACHTQAPRRTTHGSSEAHAGLSPRVCDPNDEVSDLRMVDGRCTLVNDSFVYRIARRSQPLPQWHDYHTGETRDQPQAHPITCHSPGECVEVVLVFRDWSTNDEPILRLAQNPSWSPTNTFFPMRCARTADGMICSVQLMIGTTTIVDVLRYTIMPGPGPGTDHFVAGRITGQYRGQPICVSRIGVNTYAVQAPLVDQNQAVIGSNDSWCEVYSHP